MTQRSDFTDSEWTDLTSAPEAVMAAVISAGRPGFIGAVQESKEIAETVIEARTATGASELMRALLEETGASSRPKIPLRGQPAEVRANALDTLRRANVALSANATPEEAGELRAWLLSLAERVAKAGTEGGFLGFGGTRVSEAEEAVLAEIGAALASDG